MLKFDWLEGAETEPLRAFVDDVFRTYDVQTIAPSHGCILQGAEVVQRHRAMVDVVPARCRRPGCNHGEGNERERRASRETVGEGLPRQLTPGTVWLGDCLITPLPDGTLEHSFSSAYLVSGDDRSLLVDTGHPKDWAVIEHQLEELLPERPPLEWIFPTHPEVTLRRQPRAPAEPVPRGTCVRRRPRLPVAVPGARGPDDADGDRRRDRPRRPSHRAGRRRLPRPRLDAVGVRPRRSRALLGRRPGLRSLPPRRAVRDAGGGGPGHPDPRADGVFAEYALTGRASRTSSRSSTASTR